MQSYVCTNSEKTIIFSLGRTEKEALDGAYGLAKTSGQIVATDPDGAYQKSKTGNTVWEDVPAHSLKEDGVKLLILPASIALVYQIMSRRNVLDWMENDGIAITRKEAEELDVWSRDTSKLYCVEPSISWIAYDADTAVLMSKYLSSYKKPPFIAKELPDILYDQHERFLNNTIDKFYPNEKFKFKKISHQGTPYFPGHIVEKLSLDCVDGVQMLVPESGYENHCLPVELNDIDLWQFDLIKENGAEFYYVDNGPECWKASCGRAWVILVNKDSSYSLLLMMN